MESDAPRGAPVIRGLAGAGRNSPQGRVPVPMIAVHVAALAIVSLDLFRQVQDDVGPGEAYAVAPVPSSDVAVGGSIETESEGGKSFAALDGGPEITGPVVTMEDPVRLIEQTAPNVARQFAIIRENPDFELSEVIRAAVAREDRLRMLERLAQGRIAAVKAGRWMSREVPYGYRRARPGRIEIDEERADDVALVFQLKSEGLECGQIADELVRRRIRPPGGTWSTPYIQKMLTDEVYAGWCIWSVTRPGGRP